MRNLLLALPVLALALAALGCGPDDPNTYFMPECRHDLAAPQNGGWAWHVRQALATGEGIHLDFSDPKPPLPHDVVALIDKTNALRGVACRPPDTPPAAFLMPLLEKRLRPVLLPTYVKQRTGHRRLTASTEMRIVFALLQAYGRGSRPPELRLTLDPPGPRPGTEPITYHYTAETAVRELGPLLGLYRALDD